MNLISEVCVSTSREVILIMTCDEYIFTLEKVSSHEDAVVAYTQDLSWIAEIIFDSHDWGGWATTISRAVMLEVHNLSGIWCIHQISGFVVNAVITRYSFDGSSFTEEISRGFPEYLYNYISGPEWIVIQWVNENFIKIYDYDIIQTSNSNLGALGHYDVDYEDSLLLSAYRSSVVPPYDLIIRLHSISSAGIISGLDTETWTGFFPDTVMCSQITNDKIMLVGELGGNGRLYSYDSNTITYKADVESGSPAINYSSWHTSWYSYTHFDYMTDYPIYIYKVFPNGDIRMAYQDTSTSGGYYKLVSYHWLTGKMYISTGYTICRYKMDPNYDTVNVTWTPGI